ncbi:TauD/TfdA family dioxygenase [Streptomyces sp. NPDC095817]|uniref:TauD/TfdA dioxygenase family protein n=1 Tax=Streptomyces sp. NPDC095817 TaxID=3155082 RepID=UPI003325A52C
MSIQVPLEESEMTLGPIGKTVATGAEVEWGMVIDYPSPNIGVTVSIDGDSMLLKSAAMGDIRRLVSEHGVVFLRGMKPMSDTEFERFAGQLGRIVYHINSPDVAAIRITQDVKLSNAVWHTDGTYHELPPQYSVIQAHSLPASGGDTMWANAAAAYRSLPDPLRKLADVLSVRHSNDWWRIVNSAPFESVLEAVHPLVQVIRDTGERALLLGRHAAHIEGFTREDSAALIELYQRHITSPEHVVRWRWQSGDIAIWDGRTTQHYAVPDYEEVRQMRRIWIAPEERPVGIADLPN